MRAATPLSGAGPLRYLPNPVVLPSTQPTSSSTPSLSRPDLIQPPPAASTGWKTWPHGPGVRHSKALRLPGASF